MTTVLDNSFHNGPEADEDEEREIDDELEDTESTEPAREAASTSQPKSAAEAQADAARIKNEALATLAAPLQIPQAQPQDGFVRALASTLSTGAKLLFVIAKIEEHKVLVTIQPIAHKDDAPGTVQPLQAVGAPEEIDAKLSNALSLYIPTRNLAIKSAQKVAELTTKASQAQRDAATAKANEARNKSNTKYGTLTATVVPADAVLTVKDSADNEQCKLRNGIARSLPHGKYTVTATKADYTTSPPLAVTIGKTPQTLTITLTESTPSLFAPNGDTK